MILSRKAVVLAFAFLVAVHGRASAATTLKTPLILTKSGGECLCAVTNVGLKPINVGVRMIDATSTALVPDGDTCTGTPLAPGASCFVVLNAFSLPSGQTIGGFHCVFTSSSSAVRGVGYGDGGPQVYSFPATK